MTVEPGGLTDVADVIEIVSRPTGHLLTPERFLSVAGFIQGVRLATPSLLPGFEAFVSMTYESDRVRIWPASVAFRSGVSDEAARAVLSGTADLEEDARVIEHLVAVLLEFDRANAGGEIPAIIDAYLTSGGRGSV